ncbi:MULTISPECIES: Fe-S protein assembly co-chaperone HscB [unclassified Cupriavidus]|uniref:Fe-S protein assembly co-chaperone HscB n=1 Tax=unclassified Cupriavidus TaxID=2640874 RepID=UPI0010F5D4F7|nr:MULTISPECIES: Fe-S protein assembly co-chaperone HscB [unclassified Cupriavidus]MWL86780.1 Fe-S protein assembly co-chaperone HscB [Cupriavidus sp. SW-Y-13]
MKDDFFSLFGLPARYDVDEAALEAAYRTVQSQAHPDRFANAGDAERRVAMQWAAHANEGYRTLRQPLKRAIYLLQLRGVDIQAESNTAMAPAFLMQQMEWREALQDAVETRDVGQLDSLLRELRQEKRDRHAALGALLDGADNDAASAAARQLMFIEKIEHDASEAIDRLED